MRKIRVKYSFWLLVIFTLALGVFERFLAAFIFISLHEAGHIISAEIFSVKTEKVVITPIGEMAVMKNIDTIAFWKKFVIFVSGPLVNIFFAVLFSFYKSEFFLFLKNINFLIAFFNLLPVYPLDGGRIFALFLNKIFPIILSNKIVIRTSSFFSVLFMFIGIIQIALFPYNISLFCIGLYLFKTRRKTYFGMTFDFYRYIIKNKTILNGSVPLKSFCLDKNFEIKKILRKFYFDYYCVFYVPCPNGKKIKIFEWEIIDYIQKKGVSGKISDILDI